MSRIPCPNHPARSITNFCSAPACMVSLCPQCLPSHLRSRSCDNLSIEVIDETITKARIKAQQSIKELNQHMNSLTRKRAAIIAENQKLNEETLESAKKELHRIVDGFFESLRRKIGIEDSQQRVQRTLRKYQKFKDEINENLSWISNQAQVNQGLKNLITIDTKAFLLNLRAETDFLFSNSMIYKVSFSPESLNEISAILQGSVQVKQYQQPFAEGNIYIEQNHQFTLPDYFRQKCDFKIVQEFSEQTNSIILASLTNVSANQNIKQKRLALSSPAVSQDSKSVTTHAGQVYLLGGISKSGRLDRQVYKLNFNINSLESVGSLICPRRDPSVTYTNGYVYIISGTGEGDEQLRRCQAFNVNSRQSIQISSCRFGAAGASVCVFQDRHILKFGGFDNNRFISVLEKYDIKKNTWTTAELKFSQMIPPKIATMFVFKPYALAHAVSSDSVVITGGDEVSPYNESVAVLYQESQGCFQVRTILHHKLPQRGFFISMPVVHRKTIHALMHNENNKTRLLISDLNDWIVVT